MQKILAALRGLLARVLRFLGSLWRRFRALPRWGQALVVAAIIGILFLLSSLLSGGGPAAGTPAMRAVTLRTVAELSGNVTGESVVGSVRARSEAEIRSEAGGTVRSVNTSLSASVPAGFVIAELENDSERAQVTQAEGAYDAAVAARASVSPAEPGVAAENAYQDAFDTLDTALETQVDVIFGDPTPTGPRLLINPISSDLDRLPRERARIETVMTEFRAALARSGSRDPEALLTEAEEYAQEISLFVEEVSRNASATGSDADTAELAAIAAARASVNGVLSTLSAARASYRSGSTGSTASVDAGVKAALGSLRLAEANLEKTRVRAPIGGTVNFLPLRVGQYVSMLDHVATVAQNGALEIVTYVSEEARTSISVGASVIVEGTYEGTITSIAPALDPVTKQIEVRVAMNDVNGLVNGQSVRVTLPGLIPSPDAAAGPVLLPLSAVKLTAGNRVVFTLGSDGRLVAVPVEIGEVRGERIEITSGLPVETRIVTDARGLADGQQVKAAEE